MAQALLVKRKFYRAYGSYFFENHLFSQSNYCLLLKLHEHIHVTSAKWCEEMNVLTLCYMLDWICVGKSPHLWLMECI